MQDARKGESSSDYGNPAEITPGRTGHLRELRSPHRLRRDRQQDREARYACNGNHECRRNPLRVPADWADRLIIGSVLVAVLTDNGISTVKSAITKPDEAENAGRTFPDEDVGLLREDPYFFLQAVRTMENARNFLATFITRVKLFPDRAVVHYAMPLPGRQPPGRSDETGSPALRKPRQLNKGHPAPCP